MHASLTPSDAHVDAMKQVDASSFELCQDLSVRATDRASRTSLQNTFSFICTSKAEFVLALESQVLRKRNGCFRMQMVRIRGDLAN